MEEQEQQTIPIEQVLQMQFTKVGQLTFEIEMLQQQLVAFENDNKELRKQLEGKE